MEDVRLRMQARPLRIVADSDFCVRQRTQSLHRPWVGRPHVASRDDPDARAVLSGLHGQLPQFVDENAQAAPFDERAEDVDSVRRRDLLAQLAAETGIEPCPGQKSGAGQRSVWPLLGVFSRFCVNGEQSPQWRRDAEAIGPIGTQLVRQRRDDAIDQALLALGRLSAAERREGTGQGVLKKLRERAVSVLAIDRCQGIQTGVRELIQILL